MEMENKQEDTTPASSADNQQNVSSDYPDPIAFHESKASESLPPTTLAANPTLANHEPLTISPLESSPPAVSDEKLDVPSSSATFAANPWESHPAASEQVVTSPIDQSSIATTEVPVVPTPPTQNVPFGQPKKSKKAIVVGLVIAGLLIVLGGGSALAYTWYQNPEKVLTDSLINAITAKTTIYTGTFEANGGDSTGVKVTIDGNNTSDASDLNATAVFSFGATQFTVKGSTLFDKKGDLYLKVGNLDAILAPLLAGAPTSFSQKIDTFVKKINNKWIKIDSESLDDFSSSQDTKKVQECIANVKQKFYTDKTIRDEVTNLYRKNTFVKIDKTLGTKDGNMGYVLKADNSAGKAFVKGFRDIALYKSLQGCDKSFTISDEDMNSVLGENNMLTGSLEVWVSQWGHEITKVHAESKMKVDEATNIPGMSSANFTFDLVPVFNKGATVSTPKDAIPIKDLEEDIMDIAMEFFTVSDPSTEPFEAISKTPTT
jgi:hypothetical protein